MRDGEVEVAISSNWSRNTEREGERELESRIEAASKAKKTHDLQSFS